MAWQRALQVDSPVGATVTLGVAASRAPPLEVNSRRDQEREWVHDRIRRAAIARHRREPWRGYAGTAPVFPAAPNPIEDRVGPRYFDDLHAAQAEYADDCRRYEVVEDIARRRAKVQVRREAQRRSDATRAAVNREWADRFRPKQPMTSAQFASAAGSEARGQDHHAARLPDLLLHGPDADVARPPSRLRDPRAVETGYRFLRDFPLLPNDGFLAAWDPYPREEEHAAAATARRVRPSGDELDDDTAPASFASTPALFDAAFTPPAAAAGSLATEAARRPPLRPSGPVPPPSTARCRPAAPPPGAAAPPLGTVRQWAFPPRIAPTVSVRTKMHWSPVCAAASQ